MSVSLLNKAVNSICPVITKLFCYLRTNGSGVKRIIEACEKRDVAAPTWIINGGFIVITFMRQSRGVLQDGIQEERIKQLTERQKNLFNRLIGTGQMNVLENVL